MNDLLCHITVDVARSVQPLYSPNLKYMKKLHHYTHLFVPLPFVLSQINVSLHAKHVNIVEDSTFLSFSAGACVVKSVVHDDTLT